MKASLTLLFILFSSSVLARKVLIFYSTEDFGEAQEIAVSIGTESSASTILLEDVESFQRTWLGGRDQNGQQVNFISYLRTPYKLRKLRRLIERESPDSIISTHYGVAIALVQLREHGHFFNIPIGWVKVGDRVDFLPRVSKGVDKTFFLDPQLLKTWQREGVPREKIGDAREVVEFALAGEGMDPGELQNFGVDGGERAVLGDALARLNREVPADLEVLLSDAVIDGSGFLIGTSNPFGHIGIRVGKRVYTANALAVLGEDAELLHGLSLEDYLYSPQSKTKNYRFGDLFGEAYYRNLTSLRIRGVPPESIQRMLAFIQDVNRRWQAGEAHWFHFGNNCADYVRDILISGGFDITPAMSLREQRIGMPLDIFMHALQLFKESPQYQLDMIFYQKAQGAGNRFLFSRFPLSGNHIFSSTIRILLANWRGRYFPGWKIRQRLAFYAGDTRVYYEDPSSCFRLLTR